MKQAKILFLIMIAITFSACSYPAHQHVSGPNGSSNGDGPAHTNYPEMPYVKSAPIPSTGMQKHVKAVVVSPYTPQTYVGPVFVPVQ
ncbi:MAG: hypothetical protein HQL71_14655 [Magnetococcales bacterium]|nr:hypothetical protein [Magnetococcales bacterium]